MLDCHDLTGAAFNRLVHHPETAAPELLEHLELAGRTFRGHVCYIAICRSKFHKEGAIGGKRDNRLDREEEVSEQCYLMFTPSGADGPEGTPSALPSTTQCLRDGHGPGPGRSATEVG